MDEYLVQAWSIDGQLPLLIGIAAILGLGKGGVPGLATVATALTVLTAPSTVPSGLAYAVALQVPVLTMIDVAAAWIHKDALDWTTVKILLPFSYAGMAVGQVLDQILSEGASRFLVGSLLLFVLMMRIYVDHFMPETKILRKQSDAEEEECRRFVTATDDNKDEEQDAAIILVQQSTTSSSSSSSASLSKYADNQQLSVFSLSPTFIWGAAVGIIGGASTILTNSMGPILNVYLLAVKKLSPMAYIGTRAVFFCFVNLGKLPMRIWVSHTLGWPMIPLATVLGCVSVLGVFCAKPIMLSMSEQTFVRLELAVVAFAGIRLCWVGLVQGL